MGWKKCNCKAITQMEGRYLLMTNVFVDKNVFKEAFQTRVEQIYGIKFEESTHIKDILH